MNVSYESYERARRFLVVALAVLAGVEFGGFKISGEKNFSVGGVGFVLEHPENLRYLLVFIVLYAAYRYYMEWRFVLLQGSQPLLRLTDFRLLTRGTVLLLFLFYAAEVLNHFWEGWVPHALANGMLVSAFFAWLLWFRGPAKRRYGGLLPGQILWTERVLAFLCISLVVTEVIVHKIHWLAWAGIMALPLAGLGALYLMARFPADSPEEASPQQVK